MSLPGGRQGGTSPGSSPGSARAPARQDELYRAELVPAFWLLTQTTDRRIFQQMTVPDILKQVLAGLDVAYELQGTYQPRDYCVQYRETDFDFASRLMEEEGIYYFFTHSAGGHQMVVADNPAGHPDVSAGPLIFDPRANRRPGRRRSTRWEKTQELRSGKVTLWDHCFELPEQPHLEATETHPGTRPGRHGHPQAAGRRRPQAGALRLPGRVRPAVRRRRPGGGASAESARSRRATRAAAPDAGGGRRRADDRRRRDLPAT